MLTAEATGYVEAINLPMALLEKWTIRDKINLFETLIPEIIAFNQTNASAL